MRFLKIYIDIMESPFQIPKCGVEGRVVAGVWRQVNDCDSERNVWAEEVLESLKIESYVFSHDGVLVFSVGHLFVGFAPNEGTGGLFQGREVRHVVENLRHTHIDAPWDT